MMIYIYIYCHEYKQDNKTDNLHIVHLYIYIYVLRSTGALLEKNICPVERTCCMVWMYGSQPVSRGNMWNCNEDTVLTILCQFLYEHFMFMKIYEDFHRFIICGYRLYLCDWCSLCFSSFTTEMAFKFKISSFIIHYWSIVLWYIYTVYLSLWYTFNTLHMYHTPLALETYPNYSKLMSHFIAPLLDQVGDTETSTIKTGVEEQTSRQK